MGACTILGSNSSLQATAGTHRSRATLLMPPDICLLNELRYDSLVLHLPYHHLAFKNAANSRSVKGQASRTTRSASCTTGHRGWNRKAHEQHQAHPHHRKTDDPKGGQGGRVPRAQQDAVDVRYQRNPQPAGCLLVGLHPFASVGVAFQLDNVQPNSVALRLELRRVATHIRRLQYRRVHPHSADGFGGMEGKVCHTLMKRKRRRQTVRRSCFLVGPANRTAVHKSHD